MVYTILLFILYLLFLEQEETDNVQGSVHYK